MVDSTKRSISKDKRFFSIISQSCIKYEFFKRPFLNSTPGRFNEKDLISCGPTRKKSCPRGTKEYSLGFQPQVTANIPRPIGAQGVLVRAYLCIAFPAPRWGALERSPFPGVETPGYTPLSLWDRISCQPRCKCQIFPLKCPEPYTLTIGLERHCSEQQCLSPLPGPRSESKKSFVSCWITPERANRAIILGITIKAFMMSAKHQTMSKANTEPGIISATYSMRYTTPDFAPKRYSKHFSP